MNADPEVMRYFPSTQTRDETDVAFDRICAGIAERGWGLWAVDLDGEFLGFTGLAIPRFDAHFTPATEIGWRFARHTWGNGYATEAARAVLTFAFDALELPEVVSFTTVDNLPSRRVMERIGMTRDPADDFDHPEARRRQPAAAARAVPAAPTVAGGSTAYRSRATSPYPSAIAAVSPASCNWRTFAKVSNR